MQYFLNHLIKIVYWPHYGKQSPRPDIRVTKLDHSKEFEALITSFFQNSQIYRCNATLKWFWNLNKALSDVKCAVANSKLFCVSQHMIWGISAYFSQNYSNASYTLIPKNMFNLTLRHLSKASFKVKCGDEDFGLLSAYPNPWSGVLWSNFPQIALVPQIPKNRYNSTL